MSLLRVEGNTLTCEGTRYACAIGKAGRVAAEAKREGDHQTPIGTWRLRECWYRPDRLAAPETGLVVRPITALDGWCDDPSHPQYNQHVRLPFAASHEILWREDYVYDLIIPLGYNDDPVVAGMGSAIFLHVARPDFERSNNEAIAHAYKGTEGCVALAVEDVLALLTHCSPESRIEII